MKRIFILIISLLSIWNGEINARQLQALLSHATFYSFTEGPYVETYLSIRNKSCVFVKSPDGKFRANVKVLIMFKQDTLIKNFKKYNLSSNPVEDTSALAGNFIDVQRFLIPNGSYVMEISITDLNNPSRTLRNKDDIAINFSDNAIHMSDIEFAESYKKSTEQTILSKSGYELIPQAINFFSQEQNNLIIYAELYKTENILGKSKPLLYKYYIESFETQIPLNDFARIKKDTSKQVIVILSDFDISKLPSGNYNFVIELFDIKNKLLATNKVFFQRSNPGYKLELIDLASVEADNTFAGRITDKTLLKQYINSLYPISSLMEYEFVQVQLKGNELKAMQQYFYNFWLTRNRIEPEKAWLEYFENVKKVNALFSTRIKRGYETDRGRVYLKYGAPNTIVRNENEPSAYPYEIWHYYKVAIQNDVRFVFYEPDLVTNDYELLHSTAIGEVHNEQWEIAIYKRNTAPGNQDQTTPQMHYGSKAEDYYKQPR